MQHCSCIYLISIQCNQSTSQTSKTLHSGGCAKPDHPNMAEQKNLNRRIPRKWQPPSRDTLLCWRPKLSYRVQRDTVHKIACSHFLPKLLSIPTPTHPSNFNNLCLQTSCRYPPFYHYPVQPSISACSIAAAAYTSIPRTPSF